MNDEELIAAIPALAGTRTITALPGGLTNRNLRVVCDSGEYVVRYSISMLASWASIVMQRQLTPHALSTPGLARK
ncbi:MAG: hypothetical protein V9E81_01125 [Marmoricola sp.]